MSDDDIRSGLRPGDCEDVDAVYVPSSYQSYTIGPHYTVTVPAGEERLLRVPADTWVTVQSVQQLPDGLDPRAHRWAIWWGALIGVISAAILAPELSPDDARIAAVVVLVIAGALLATGITQAICWAADR